MNIFETCQSTEITPVCRGGFTISRSLRDDTKVSITQSISVPHIPVMDFWQNNLAIWNSNSSPTIGHLGHMAALKRNINKYFCLKI